jgi:hypothetical protein
MQTIRTSPIGWVYLLSTDYAPFFKIGFTRGSIDRRALQLQVGCPLTIRIQGQRRGTYKDETALLRALRRYRVNGEWFSPPEPVAWSLLAYFGREIPSNVPVSKNWSLSCQS